MYSCEKGINSNKQTGLVKVTKSSSFNPLPFLKSNKNPIEESTDVIVSYLHGNIDKKNQGKNLFLNQQAFLTGQTSYLFSKKLFCTSRFIDVTH